MRMNIFSKRLLEHYCRRMPLKHFGEFLEEHISRVSGTSEDDRYLVYGRIVGERESVVREVATQGRTPTQNILDEIGAAIETDIYIIEKPYGG